MTDGYIKFNDVLTAVGNMLKEMGSKEIKFPKIAKDCECFTCEHLSKSYNDYPCNECCRCYMDMYREKKGDSNG